MAGAPMVAKPTTPAYRLLACHSPRDLPISSREANARSGPLCGRRRCGAARLDEVPTDLVGELQLGVVLGGVANHLAGVDDAPEGAGVAGDAVEDLEGDPVLVFDVGRLERLDEELSQVAGTDIGPEVALVADGVAVAAGAVRKEGLGLDLARGADPDLDVLELAALGATGVQEAERLVGDLGPDEAVNSYKRIRQDAPVRWSA